MIRENEKNRLIFRKLEISKARTSVPPFLRDFVVVVIIIFSSGEHLSESPQGIVHLVHGLVSDGNRLVHFLVLLLDGLNQKVELL